MFDTILNLNTVGSPDRVAPALTEGLEVGQLSAMIINVLMGVTFGIGIIAIAYSMILFITSRGQPDEVLRARTAFIWGVTATFVGLLAVVLRRLVFSTLGVDIPGVSDGVPTF